MTARANYIDLSHTIEHGLVTFKGLPPPLICDYLSREDSRKNYAPGTEFQIAKLEMVANTGTYLDCPFHRYANGKDLSEISLSSLVDLEGVLVRVVPENSEDLKNLCIDEEVLKKSFSGKEKEMKGRAVLIHTGWDRFWNTETYYTNHPFLTESAALYLRTLGVTLVGIDSHNIDDIRGKTRPVHSILLEAEIMIVEHLCNLQEIPGKSDFSFTALPPKWKGVGTFPVRAIAKVSL